MLFYCFYFGLNNNKLFLRYTAQCIPQHYLLLRTAGVFIQLCLAVKYDIHETNQFAHKPVLYECLVPFWYQAPSLITLLAFTKTFSQIYVYISGLIDIGELKNRLVASRGKKSQDISV